MKYAVHFLEPEQECAVMVSMALLLSTPAHLKVVWPQANDKKDSFDPTDVEVVVVPLHRIGASGGKSGAEVFVVYLRSVRQDAVSLPPSDALVVKLQKRPDKLTREKEAADQWPKVDGNRFAKPILLYSVRGYTVLIAPFRAGVTRVPDEHRLKFQVPLKDLYRILVGGGNSSAGSSANVGVSDGVRDALGLVAQAHCGVRNPSDEPPRGQMHYSEIYKRYLRKALEGGEAHALMEQLFGIESEVCAFGVNWPNPVKVLRFVLDFHDSFEGVMGPAHGDLHPKNIIFDAENQAHIIDFGWARSMMHVVVDYVLLDINLRAMTMAPQVPEQELLAVAGFLCATDSIDGVTDVRLRDRLRVVQEIIWHQAIENKAVSTDRGQEWVKEYLIPYFLVAYGLLVYLDEAQNQRAMLASVLAAAKRIHSELTL